GEDLVEWQLRVASGEPLPRAQDELHIHGHALEARIYAENPERDFLPSIGTLKVLRTPAAVEFTVGAQANGEPAAVRIDAGVREGDAISPYYDPMIAKLIVWGRDREEALARMRQALGSFHLVGLSSNVAFLRRLVASKPFATADLDTGLIARNHDTLFPAAPDVPLDAIALAVAALLAREARSLRTDTRDPHSPWARGSGWRLNGAAERTLRFTHGDQSIDATLIYGRDGSRLKVGGSEAPFTSQRHAETFTVTLGTHKATGQVHADGDAFHVFTGGAHWTLERHDPLAHAGEADDEGGKLTAPMPGKVIAVLAAPGQTVAKGAPLVVMEAMKMEHTLTAPADGVVESVLYGVGDQVTEGVQLLAFKPAE
ncbi:MAG: biotin/lipoyl-containing protein, partial [Ralstonia sp.]